MGTIKTNLDFKSVTQFSVATKYKPTVISFLFNGNKYLDKNEPSHS